MRGFLRELIAGVVFLLLFPIIVLAWVYKALEAGE